jgi:hypothetical protein
MAPLGVSKIEVGRTACIQPSEQGFIACSSGVVASPSTPNRALPVRSDGISGSSLGSTELWSGLQPSALGGRLTVERHFTVVTGAGFGRSWPGMRSLLRHFFRCSSLSVLFWSTPVPAQSVNLVALEWFAEETCPDGASIARRVSDLAGPMTRHEPLRATGVVSNASRGVRLHLETHDAGQTFVRDVDLPTCQQAAETVALILAMALRGEVAETVGNAPPEPSAGAPAAESSRADVSTLPPPPMPSAPPPPPPGAEVSIPPPALVRPNEPSLEPESRVGVAAPERVTLRPVDKRALVETPPEAPERFSSTANGPSFGAGAALGWAIVPRALWSVTAQAAFTVEPWRFELVAGLAPPQRSSLPEDASRGGEFVLWHAGIRSCYLVSVQALAPLRGLACLGAEGGQLRAEGFGTTLRELGISPWWALSGGLGVLVELADQARVVVRMEGVAPLRRDSFVLSNPRVGEGKVAEPAALVGRLGLVFEVVF